tara:strand:+ start:2822 stop:3547 length:726 start_codon:yes stop_codon:yes gene_type:complete
MGLMDWMGMGNANSAMENMDPSAWNYNAAQANYGGTGARLSRSMYDMNQSAAGLNTQGTNLMNQGQQFMDPNSAHYQKQRGFLNEALSTSIADGSRSMNRNLAARGVGGGGIRSMLGATNANQIGEQVRTGSNQMYQQGMNTGTSLLGMGMQGLQGAGSLYGQVGQLGAGIDNRNLQQAMFNTGQTNDSSKFNAQNTKDFSTMNYNNAAAQDANVAGLWGSAIGLGGSFAGGYGFGLGGKS